VSGRVSEGRCLCGEVRVRAAGEPSHVTYCHCSDCRKASGAPTMVFAGYRAGEVEVNGEPKVYGSSPGIRRSFCGGCGTSLFYEDAERLPGEVYVAVGLFDDPGPFEPEEHSWDSRRPAWFRVHDDLPRYQEGPPWHGHGKSS